MRRSERPLIAEYYQRVFGKDLPESIVGSRALMAEPALDRFRRALAGAARAIARDAEVEVVFASDDARRRRQDRARRLARAVARAAAGRRGARRRRSRWRSGCATTMPAPRARTRPADAEARAVFDALETARVEALGARAMAGVRANLAELAEARVRGDAITRARTAEEVPLATAVGLIARAAADRRGAARGRARRARAGRAVDRGEGRRPSSTRWR